jgi:hypothetical protein
MSARQFVRPERGLSNLHTAVEGVGQDGGRAAGAPYDAVRASGSQTDEKQMKIETHNYGSFAYASS